MDGQGRGAAFVREAMDTRTIDIKNMLWGMLASGTQTSWKIFIIVAYLWCAQQLKTLIR